MELEEHTLINHKSLHRQKPSLPPHVGHILGRHVEDAIWQMLLGEIRHQQYVVYGILYGGQIVDPHTRPGHHLGAIVRDEQRQADAVAQILEVPDRRYIRRLQAGALKAKQLN